jgi:hypothetical protein
VVSKDEGEATVLTGFKRDGAWCGRPLLVVYSLRTSSLAVQCNCTHGVMFTLV